MLSRPGAITTPIKARRTDQAPGGQRGPVLTTGKDGSPPREGVLGWGGNSFLGCERKEPLKENSFCPFPPSFIADVMAGLQEALGAIR